jgi:hypothetical protein
MICAGGWNEPDSGVGVKPVFVVAEKNPIGVGEHEDSAGAKRRSYDTVKRQCEGQFHCGVCTGLAGHAANINGTFRICQWNDSALSPEVDLVPGCIPGWT